MGKAAPGQSELRSRLAATVELAAAALAAQGHSGAQLRKSLELLKVVVPRLAQDVSRPANDFRQTFFGAGANPLTAWSVQRAVSAVVHANDYAGLQRAGDDLASAFATVGADKWFPTLQTAGSQAVLADVAAAKASAAKAAVAEQGAQAPTLTDRVLGALNLIGSAKAAGTKNPMRSHPEAAGDHSAFRRGSDGTIQHYETYDKNPYTGQYGPKLRFRGEGRPHAGVPPPHIHERDPGQGPGTSPTQTRPAKPSEIPRSANPTPSIPDATEPPSSPGLLAPDTPPPAAPELPDLPVPDIFIP